MIDMKHTSNRGDKKGGMEEVSEDARTVLEALPPDGSIKGNRTLMKQLGMGSDRFFKAKNELLKNDFIVSGRGRGGSIRRRTQAMESAEPPETPVETPSTAKRMKMSLSESANKILESLPKDGTMVGNTSLRKRLAMDATKFFQAKAELQGREIVVAGKGRGGSIGLAKITGLPSQPSGQGGVKDEGSLYEPIKKYFDENWGPNYTPPDYFCAVVTGTPKGHKRRSGLWSRPDVSILTVSSYQFLPTKQIEVTTIEAKKYSDATPQAVFETASQSKFAHQSYLVIEWLEKIDMEDTDNDNVKRILKEAQRFGIGIIQMKKKGHGGWEFREILDPQRREPDPDDCNAFIEQAFKDHHQQILGALGKR